MKSDVIWKWRVVFMNDTQGFKKTYWADGKFYTDAVREASDELQRQGYKRDDFSLVYVNRGRIV
jgi:hypothetical protein